MARYAMWIHANSMQVEDPKQGEFERKGWSAKYDGGSQWLHCAIPTPVLVPALENHNLIDKRCKVQVIKFKYKTSTFGAIQRVHIYDGENFIFGRDDLNLISTVWKEGVIDVPAQPLIHWGLGISFFVFTPPGVQSEWVEFSSAGCDFIGPDQPWQ